MFKKIITIGTLLMSFSYVYAADVKMKEIGWLIDDGREEGPACEIYKFIPKEERLKIVNKKNSYFVESAFEIYYNQKDIIKKDLKNCYDIDKEKYSSSSHEETLEYLGDNIISLKVENYFSFAGAMRGDSTIKHYVFDRENGKLLKWKDIFIADTKELNAYILVRIENELAFKDFISSNKKKLLNYRKFGYFGFTNDGLIIQFDRYEIAPGSSGAPSLIVPKQVLKRFMNKRAYDRIY